MAGITWEKDHHVISDSKSVVADLSFMKELTAVSDDASVKQTADALADSKVRTFWHIFSKAPLNYSLCVAYDPQYTPPDGWWEDPVAPKEAKVG